MVGARYTPPSRAGFRARWFDARNRLVAHPRFQRWASRFPLTKRTAAVHASGLFDICAGFVYSQILFACVELKLFERLVDGAKPVSTLAALCGLEPEAMRRLLRAATPLKLVEPRGLDGYGLGMNGAAFLGNPGIEAMVAHHAMFYRDLADPIALFKSPAPRTELSHFWPYAGADDPRHLAAETVAPYSELMSRSQGLVADDVLDAWVPLGKQRCLMDIGGGGGDFLVAAAHRHRDLRVVLFDLPTVADRAATRFAAERLAGRWQTRGGDFKRDPLPEGADAMSLVRVAHDLDDDALDALLAKIFAALPSNGILLLAEPMANTPGAEKVGAYFDMYLLAMQRGRPRSADEMTKRLSAAGFAQVRCVATSRPMLTSLIVARKSGTPVSVVIDNH